MPVIDEELSGKLKVTDLDQEGSEGEREGESARPESPVPPDLIDDTR